MALTEDQWFERLKSWVPKWFLVDELRNVAILRSIAATISEAGIETDDLISRTFIQEAYDSWLDLHGNERDVSRLTDELDSKYGARIVSQSLISRCNIPAIKAMVDSLLDVGTCQIREDYIDGPYFSRGSYLNRDAILIDNILNAFSIIVPKQLHSPYEFYSRGAYADREDYIGTESQVEAVFDSLVEAVNAIKAFGVLYRIIESENPTVF